MASPVAHTLAGLTIGFLSWRRVFKSGLAWKSVLFCAVMANLADFDVIPGILAGDMNRYHHDHSHSLLFAFVVSLLVFALARKDRVKWSLMSFGLLVSHLVIDFFTIDASPPIGLPLLWPFTGLDTRFKSRFAFLPSVARGETVLSVFNCENVHLLVVELAVFLPPAAAAYLFYRCRSKRP